MSTHLELFRSPLAGPVAIFSARPRGTRYLLGIVAIGVAYYASAKLGQTLGYTASVAAIWPPAGLGIAVLYLRGLGWWPGAEQALLEIRDGGRGVRPAADHRGHFRLDSMRGRADQISATLSVVSAPGEGTRVRVDMPLATEASTDAPG